MIATKILTRLALAIAMPFLISASFAFGQASTTGSIAGTVTDSTGSVITGATVTIVDTLSGTTYTNTTSGTGSYVIPAVRPGTYKETVTAAGFSNSATDG